MSLLQMSISGAAMILAVIVIRALAINRLPKKTFIALWGIVLLRLLVPFSFPSPFSAYSLVNNHVTASQGTTGIGITTIFPISPAAFPTAGGVLQGQTTVSISPFVIAWGIGMIACALFFTVSYFKYRREFRESLPIKNDFLTKWIAGHKLARPVEIRQSSHICAPLTYGIWKPVILMPKNTNWENSKQIDYVLAHEFVHIRRFDAAKKLILTASLCIHWFNPLVWVMYILSNRDAEISCDETVIRSFGDSTKTAYALTLISMEESKSRLTPLCNNFSKNAVEERITAIMKMKKTTIAALAAAALLIGGVTTAFATSAVAQDNNPLIAIPNTAFTAEEYDKVIALQFDGYANMTVADYREKAITIIDRDHPGYSLLLERMFQDEQLSEMRYTDETASFLNNTLFPLIFANWKEVSFSSYIDSPYSVQENDGRLEYTITRTILNPDQLTVGVHDRTIQGIMDNLQTFIDSKSSAELQDKRGMNAAVKTKLERLIDKWETKDLKLDISYYYTPLTVFDTPDENMSNKITPEEERGIPGKQQDYSSLLSLKTSNYKKLSVADFNDSLLAWTTDHEKAHTRIMKDVVMEDIQANLTDEELSFVTLTLPVSNAQNTINVLHENNGTPKIDPIMQYSYTKEEANVWYMLWYQLSIQIPDENKLTIGERDRYLSKVINGFQNFWSDKDFDELAAMDEELFKKKLTALADQNSNNLIRLEIIDLSFQGFDERSLANN